MKRILRVVAQVICRRLFRLSAYPFAAVIGLTGVNSAVTLFLYPERSPVHQLVSPLDYIWALMYGLGGLMILVGIAWDRSDVETAGCLAFGGGALIQAFVWISLLGWDAWNAFAILLLFSAAALLRAYHIATGRVLVLIQLKDNEPSRIVAPGGSKWLDS